MRKKHKDQPGQLKLFDQVKLQHLYGLVTPGSLDIDSQFRELISEAIRKSQYSRHPIAARMSELTGHEITKSMLDSWSAESKENHRFPAIFIPAFCEAVGNRDILTLLCEKAGTFNMKGPEALRAEIRQIDEAIISKKAEKRKRETFLKEMEG